MPYINFCKNVGCTILSLKIKVDEMSHGISSLTRQQKKSTWEMKVWWFEEEAHHPYHSPTRFKTERKWIKELFFLENGNCRSAYTFLQALKMTIHFRNRLSPSFPNGTLKTSLFTYIFLFLEFKSNFCLLFLLFNKFFTLEGRFMHYFHFYLIPGEKA